MSYFGLKELTSAAAILALGTMAASAATVVDEACLAFGACTVSGGFSIHPDPNLAAIGVWEAVSSFTLEAPGDVFFGRTTPFSVPSEWIIEDQFGTGSSNFVDAGISLDLLFERAPLQNPTFTLTVNALFGGVGDFSAEMFEVIATSQPIEDALIAADLLAQGVSDAGSTPLAELRTVLGLDADADLSTILTAANAATGAPDPTDGGTAVDGAPDIAPVPLPAAGWLLVLGIGAMSLVRRRG